jgi:hypothetical protein
MAWVHYNMEFGSGTIRKRAASVFLVWLGISTSVFLLLSSILSNVFVSWRDSWGQKDDWARVIEWKEMWRDVAQ